MPLHIGIHSIHGIIIPKNTRCFRKRIITHTHPGGYGNGLSPIFSVCLIFISSLVF